ncbi:MAG: integration host factor, actinobacterial type [Acidimicrobiales bacterium]
MRHAATTTADRGAAPSRSGEGRSGWRARAEFKEQLKMGSLSLKALLERAEDDDVIGKMKVSAVLEALPGVGKVKAKRTMEDIGISESRRVRGLGDQQRAALLKTFPG